MSFFVEWNDYLKVNVEALDEQNRQLTKLINKTYNALLKEENSLDFEGVVFEELFSYAREHFLIEEELMAQNSYHGLEDHKSEHNDYEARLREIFQKHQSGLSVATEVLQHLKWWLKSHVLKKDKDLGIFLNSRGIN